MNKRTYDGLDVHERSVKGCAIDRATIEILRQSLIASDAAIAEWVAGVAGPCSGGLSLRSWCCSGSCVSGASL
jgi:hypothetical protein